MSTTATEGARRYVVGVDGSPSSIAALRWVARLAQAVPATVVATTTWEWPTSYGVALFLPSDYDPAADAATMLARSLDPVQAEFPGVTFETEVVEGHPAPVLVEASRTAELLAVGSRGHGEFAGMLIGSVSEHCAAHAHCPVLVIRRDSETGG
jgi:nucleotide-binding universal stress UspA family protein